FLGLVGRGAGIVKISNSMMVNAITSTQERAILRTLRLRVDFPAGFVELSCLLFESLFDCGFFRNPLLGCVFSYVFRYLHTAKMGSAHGAEMRGLRAFLGKSLTKLMPIIFARCLAGLTVYVASPQSAPFVMV